MMELLQLLVKQSFRKNISSGMTEVGEEGPSD
jgi:hypothetical protein